VSRLCVSVCQAMPFDSYINYVDRQKLSLRVSQRRFTRLRDGP